MFINRCGKIDLMHYVPPMQTFWDVSVVPHGRTEGPSFTWKVEFNSLVIRPFSPLCCVFVSISLVIITHLIKWQVTVSSNLQVCHWLIMYVTGVFYKGSNSNIYSHIKYFLVQILYWKHKTSLSPSTLVDLPESARFPEVQLKMDISHLQQ